VFACFFKDKKGATVVTYALILPLLILLIFGTVEIWRVMAVRQSLNLGVYQAMRTLSWQGRLWLPRDQSAWELLATERARDTIATTIALESQGDAFTIVPENSTLQVWVTVGPEAPAYLTEDELGWFFTVRAELAVHNVITVEPLASVFPERSLTVAVEQWGYIEGKTGDWMPPPEGPPY